VTVADAEHALKSKLGATRDRSGDHVYFYFRDGESEYTVGKLSHSWKGQLNDTQITMLAKKLRLLKREFEDFVSCSLEKDQMVALWRQRRL
jgi:hypothetical protein